MTNPFPKTPLTRGSLSGGTQLLIACLLVFPASHLLLPALHDGVTAQTIIGALLWIAAVPLITRGLWNVTVETVLLFCDEQTLVIREQPGRHYISTLASLRRIVRDCRGYTLQFENRYQFRLRRKDANPQHLAILDAQYERQESFLSAADSSKAPVV